MLSLDPVGWSRGERGGGEGGGHQNRLVSVVCDGLRHSWTSMPPGTELSTEVTVGMVGLVKSVRVVGVLEGLMEALEISEAGPDGVPPCSVEPSDALSTPVLSCRSRFLLNLARAFWNQTCGDKVTKSITAGELSGEVVRHGTFHHRLPHIMKFWY